MKLKQCPFCGGRPEEENFNGKCRIICFSCKSSSDWYSHYTSILMRHNQGSRSMANRAWNERVKD